MGNKQVSQPNQDLTLAKSNSQKYKEELQFNAVQHKNMELQQIVDKIDQIVNILKNNSESPQYLQQLITKLLYMKELFVEFLAKKIQNLSLNQKIIDQIYNELENFYLIILKKKSNMPKDKQLMDFTSEKDKTDIQLFLAVIEEDLKEILDTFPEYLKKNYKNKPGYDTWKYLFGNKDNIKRKNFIYRYSLLNEVAQEQMQTIFDVIDTHKSENIDFEQYMEFINKYNYYFDAKGSRIIKFDELWQCVKNLVEEKVEIKVQGKKLTYPDGAIYEGDLHQNQRHGKGVFKRDQNYVYEGQFVNDIKEGFGVEIKFGNKYEGQWKANTKCGQGKLVYKDGAIYKGMFANDVPHGQGCLTSADNNVYEGIFEDGQMIEGKIMYKNGEVYQGQTSNTIFRHGKGKILNAKGQIIFEGNFMYDTPSQTYIYRRAEDFENIQTHSKEITHIEINIETKQKHLKNNLLANLLNLQTLKIEFINLKNCQKCAQLTMGYLQNIHPQVLTQLTELQIIISNEKMKKISQDEFTSLFALVRQFPNLTLLNLSLQYWGAGNPLVNNDIIQDLINTYQSFKKLQHLTLDLHQWGYQNQSLQNEQIVDIIKGLEVFQLGQLKTFQLDLGRWGCDTYESYKFLTDFTLKKMVDLLNNQKSLENLSLNIRSWGYRNENITNIGATEFFNGLSKLTNLKKLQLGLRHLGYDNKQITHASFISMIQCIQKLQNLEEISIELGSWSYIDSEKVDELFVCLENLPKLQKQDINF